MKKNDFNFLYWIFRPFILTIWKVYYRIYIRNGHYLKLDKPTLIIANHSNSVVDPVAIAVSKYKGFYFLPRGDVFNSSFKKWLLWQFHMIPIYRREEGIENMHKNEETFRRIYGLLNKKKPVIIFSEGKCIQEKRQRTFRKGTARIAFEFDELYKEKEELEFLPIALNYHHWNKFNSDLCINVGKPFKLSELDIDYKNDRAKAINQFNQEAEKRLKELMVIIENPELDGLEIDLEKLLEDQLYKISAGTGNSQEAKFIFRKKISDALSNFFSREKEKALILKSNLHLYQNALKEAGLRNSVMESGQIITTFFSFVLLLLSSPIHLLGMATNYMPYKIPIVIANKKIKLIEFYSTVVIVLALILFIIWYGFLFSVLSAYHNDYVIGFLLLPIVGILGWFSYKWWRLWKITKGRLNYFFIKVIQPELIDKLNDLRIKVNSDVTYFSKNYLNL